MARTSILAVRYDGAMRRFVWAALFLSSPAAIALIGCERDDEPVSTKGDASTDGNADASNADSASTGDGGCIPEGETCDVESSCCAKVPEAGYNFTCRQDKRCGQCAPVGTLCDPSQDPTSVCCLPGNRCQPYPSDPSKARCCLPSGTPCNIATAFNCCSQTCESGKCGS